LILRHDLRLGLAELHHPVAAHLHVVEQVEEAEEQQMIGP